MSRLDEIRGRLGAATPGPWEWRGHRSAGNGGMFLGRWQPGAGLCIVMDFVRQGMRGAQPRFAIDLMMHKGEDLAVQEVEYRDDVKDIDHPDARLIAHAPDDIAFLLGRVDALTDALEGILNHTELAPVADWSTCRAVGIEWLDRARRVLGEAS